MKTRLKFLNEFFRMKELRFDNYTITVQEQPCYNFASDDYFLRFNIAEVTEEIDIYRKMAIESQPKQPGHDKPHIQFKLNADKIGKIYILLPVTIVSDFQSYVVSFLDNMREVLLKIDNPAKDIQKKLMVMESFNNIIGSGRLLKKAIADQFMTGTIEVITPDNIRRKLDKADVPKLRMIPQIAPFVEEV